MKIVHLNVHSPRNMVDLCLKKLNNMTIDNLVTKYHIIENELWVHLHWLLMTKTRGFSFERNLCAASVGK